MRQVILRYQAVLSAQPGNANDTPVAAAASSIEPAQDCDITGDPISGRVFLIFEEDGEIDLVYSDNDGRSWSPSPIRVDDDSSGAMKDNPVIVSRGGEVHAFWSDLRNVDFDIYYSRSTNNGATWGDGVSDSDLRVDDTDSNLSTSDDETNQATVKAVLLGGNPMAIWRDWRSESAGTKLYTLGGPRPIITEFRDEPVDQILIEIYNPSILDFDFSLMSIGIDGRPGLPLS